MEKPLRIIRKIAKKAFKKRHAGIVSFGKVNK